MEGRIEEIEKNMMDLRRHLAQLNQIYFNVQYQIKWINDELIRQEQKINSLAQEISVPQAVHPPEGIAMTGCLPGSSGSGDGNGSIGTAEAASAGMDNSGNLDTSSGNMVNSSGNLGTSSGNVGGSRNFEEEMDLLMEGMPPAIPQLRSVRGRPPTPFPRLHVVDISQEDVPPVAAPPVADPPVVPITPPGSPEPADDYSPASVCRSVPPVTVNYVDGDPVAVGASPEQIAEYTNEFVYHVDADVPVVDRRSCGICKGEIMDGELVREMKGCGHVYHTDCIDPWLPMNGSCAVCRWTLQ